MMGVSVRVWAELGRAKLPLGNALDLPLGATAPGARTWFFPSELAELYDFPPGDGTGQRLKYRQLLLFEARRDLRAHGRTGLLERCDPALADHVDTVVADHARRHGWTGKATNQTQIGIRILLGLREHPDDLVKATDIVLLTAIDLGVTRVRELLADMGLLDDDRAPTVDRWFADHIADLPAPIRDELAVWFVVMRDGSTTSPRRKPRTETTIAVQLRMAMPVLGAWSTAGITSLREVTRDDLTIALPPAGNARAGAGQALKSIFGVLKARKVVFTNPAARVTTGWYQPHQPLPHDPAVLLQALTDPDPTRALIVALIAFHGLRMAAVRHLQLTDIRDRQLHQPGRTIPLAAPVITRLAAYLDDRAAAWPATLNPHLLVNSRSAWRDTPVGQRWVHLKIGEPLTAQSIREDRILLEAHATGGDTRALTDLFGLSITAATRYTDTVAHDGFTQLANRTR